MNDRDLRPLTVAVFGDTHGHLRLMVELCRRWQLEHGEHLDLVLQCGDLGYYPDLGRLDRATRRFARRDPEELGFARFFAPEGLVEQDHQLQATLLGPPEDLATVRCPVLWCHGNHEDFARLADTVGSRDLVAVDRFRRLRYLQSGRQVRVARVTGAAGVPGFDEVIRLEGRDTVELVPEGADLVVDGTCGPVGPELTVAALGGGPEPDGMVEDDGGAPEPLGWVGRRSADRLVGLETDLLVAHCAPAGVVTGTDLGSRRLREVVDRAEPAYCFYAHHGRPVPAAVLGRTRAHWLADVNFERNTGPGMYPYGRLASGCMGLLRWAGPESHRFEIVEEPWMQAVTWSSWRHW